MKDVLVIESCSLLPLLQCCFNSNSQYCCTAGPGLLDRCSRQASIHLVSCLLMRQLTIGIVVVDHCKGETLQLRHSRCPTRIMIGQQLGGGSWNRRH